MDLSFLFRGLIIGVSIAAPVGPLAVLCIRRTLTQGRVAGLVSALGIASADAVYGAIGGFGLTFISSFLLDHQFWLRLIGGLFLCYLGFKTWRTKPAENTVRLESKAGLAGMYVSTFLLTLTNPLTILSFAAILAGLGLGSTGGDYLAASILIVGVFLGSAGWWLVLTTVVSLFRSKISSKAMVWINRVSALVIFGFGLLALASLLG